MKVLDGSQGVLCKPWLQHVVQNTLLTRGKNPRRTSVFFCMGTNRNSLVNQSFPLSHRSHQKFNLTQRLLNLDQVIIIIISDTCQTKPACVVYCLIVTVAQRSLSPALDSDGSLHLLDYVRDLKPGLGHWSVKQHGGSVSFLHHRGVLGCVGFERGG